ncbi:MAG: HDOD domain-containing protein [Verrucomicrobia bacterium]|nr:HDOD domain-containing protein [Verrucomicrobiota bacterium]
MLGLETVKSLVLWVHIFSQYQHVNVEGFSIEKLSHHSLTTGRLAWEIVLSERGDQAMGEEAMTAGLLHDIGKLLLALNMPDSYNQARGMALGGALTLTEAERAQFGTTHAEIGAYLLGLWGLPGNIVDAVALHHTPGLAKVKSFSALTAVHAANVLEREFSGQEIGGLPLLDTAYLASLNLTNRLDAWRALLQTVELQPD